MDIEREIELINEIIIQAIIHGGDSGGSYCSNGDKLYKALKEWIKEKDLEDKYKIIEGECTDSDGYDHTDMLFIVKKEDPREEYKIIRKPFAF